MYALVLYCQPALQRLASCAELQAWPALASRRCLVYFSYFSSGLLLLATYLCAAALNQPVPTLGEMCLDAVWRLLRGRLRHLA